MLYANGDSSNIRKALFEFLLIIGFRHLHLSLSLFDIFMHIWLIFCLTSLFLCSYSLNLQEHFSCKTDSYFCTVMLQVSTDRWWSRANQLDLSENGPMLEQIRNERMWRIQRMSHTRAWSLYPWCLADQRCPSSASTFYFKETCLTIKHLHNR